MVSLDHHQALQQKRILALIDSHWGVATNRHQRVS